MKYFTADQHFFHANIIKYANRPFENTYFMNKTIISNYRKVVREEDEVYFLGDLMMGGMAKAGRLTGIINGLPGVKHLILGNHDRLKPRDIYVSMGFSSVQKRLEVTLEGTEFHMVHNPANALLPNVKWLCGHIHAHWLSKKNDIGAVIVNVGVDVWDFSPVSLEQVLTEFKKYEGY